MGGRLSSSECCKAWPRPPGAAAQLSRYLTMDWSAKRVTNLPSFSFKRVEGGHIGVRDQIG